MKILQIILGAVAFATLAPNSVAQVEHAMPVQAEGESTLVTVHVKGMVCDFCARSVSKVFGKNEAVEGVHVDLDSGEIHVGLKAGMSLSDEDVEAMVKKSGYALVSIERETL